MKGIYMLYDLKAETTLASPMLETTHAAAIRAFNSVLAQQGQIFALHPMDFALLYLGKIDIETGNILAEQPEIITSGKKEKQERDMSSERIGPAAIDQLEIPTVAEAVKYETEKLEKRLQEAYRA